MNTSERKVALITGASRGVGARTATLLAKCGVDIVVNYRQRLSLAERVERDVQALGANALLVGADLTDAHQAQKLVDSVEQHFGRLDILVLNASGGLEIDKPPDYAMRLNVDAQVRTLDLSSKLMRRGGRVVFVTSHHAHFYGQCSTVPEYAAVAASKHAGEAALRARIPVLRERGIDFVVVSGDVIERTVTAILLERARPELFKARRARGPLLTVEEFASAVARAALEEAASLGGTIYVGSTEPDG